ncbi:MAG: DNA polymerase III subunit delta' [Gammaproteobacteria bacterium]
MSAPYPWQDEPWAAVCRRLDGGSLGHAYLLGGREGLGKLAFARALAGLVLCEERQGPAACGACRGCALLAAGNHPDLQVTLPEEGKRAVLVDQIRELIGFFDLKPHYGASKVAIVCPADTMNVNAANALLKILEEPPAGALIILVANRPGRLLPTLLSRCQRLDVPEPAWSECLAWLESRREAGAAIANPDGLVLMGAPLAIEAQLAGGATPPGEALMDALGVLAADPLAVSEAARTCAEHEASAVLDAFEMLVSALAMAPLETSPAGLHLPPARARQLQEIADKLNSKRLFLFLDRIEAARAMVLRSSGIRGGEVLENLFYRWTQVTTPETTP